MKKYETTLCIRCKKSKILIHVEKNKDNCFEKYDPLDLIGPDGLKRLLVKYRDFKSKWKKITDNAKHGRCISGKKDEEWYAILNPCFSEKNVQLTQVRSSDSSLLAERDLDEHDSEEENLDDPDDRDDQLSEEENDFIVEGIEKESSATSSKINKRKYLSVKPHEKGEVFRSQNQAITQLSGNIKTIIQAQEKRWKADHEYNVKRDKDFQREQRALDR